MPYDPNDLTPTSPSTLAWALAWCRFYLRDTDPASPFYDDAELTGMLAATSQELPRSAASPTVYYRPHEAAADLIESDPDRRVQERLMSWSGENRNASEVARSIRTTGAWIDDAIADAAGEAPRSGATLTPTF